MPFQKSTAWLDYVQEQRLQSQALSIPEVGEIETFLSLINNIPPLFQHALPFMYLLDYRTGLYTIFSNGLKTFVGHKMEYFEKGGIDFTIGTYHKQDLELFSNNIFPDRVKFLENIKPQEHSKYIFSYNFRFKNKSGDYSTILQRNRFISSDENGKPLLSLGIGISMDHYKNPNTCIQLIEKESENDSANTTIFKKTYLLNERDRSLTRRETEILKMLAMGLSSKLIADKLYLSEHTIIVHRKNILQKTNCSNVAHLISWAIQNELI